MFGECRAYLKTTIASSQCKRSKRKGKTKMNVPDEIETRLALLNVAFDAFFKAGKAGDGDAMFATCELFVIVRRWFVRSAISVHYDVESGRMVLGAEPYEPKLNGVDR